jgi:hypothetical protein
VRSRTMRATTSSGVDLGLPRSTPFTFLTCSASRVRILMKLRSSSAKTTAMRAIALPIGVRVSNPHLGEYQPPVLLLCQQDRLNQGETSGASRENPLGYRL